MKNIFSIDLESWIYFFHEASRRDISAATSEERKRLDAGYLPEAVPRILELLSASGQKATFFTLGEIHDWYPELIRRIADAGHEIAYHSHSHALITSARVLGSELGLSEDFLRRYRPKGFRAPRIHVTNESMDLLKERGFVYSSSSYDRHKILKIGGIDEIPVSTLTYSADAPVDSKLPKELSLGALTRKFPFGSGFFISLLGRNTSNLITRLNQRGVPAVLFVHPWQIVQPPAMRGAGFKLRLLFQNPLHLPYAIDAHDTVRHLLNSHAFTTFEDYYYADPAANSAV